MKRKLTLIIISFLGLLLAFGFYCLVVGSQPQGPRTHPAPPRSREISSMEPGPDAREGVGFYMIRRDADNALQGIYRAKDWKRSKDGKVSLNEPFFTLFQKDNQQVHITADKAEIYADEVGQNFRLRKGILTGGVKILLDQGRGTDPRPPLDSRPDDMVQILLEDVDFNNDLLQITTDHSVQLASAKADIEGKGLTIRWNERPQELRDMELREGHWMKIKAVPEQYGVISLPGGQKPADTSGSPTSLPAPWPDRRMNPATMSDPFQRLQSTPSLLPSSEQTPIELIASPSTSPDVPATGPTSRGVKKNVYEAQFTSATQDIKVEQAGRKLTGAGALTFRFDWSNDSQDTAGKKPAKAPTPSPAAGPAKAGTPDKPAPTPMIMTWTGPLKLMPVGTIDKPAKDHYTIAASGDKVVLSDQQSTATCKRFEFRSPEQVGHLYGKPEEPATATLSGDDKVFCEHIAFDRTGEVINLTGPGTMVHKSGGALAIGGASSKPASDVLRPTLPAAASAPAPTDTIKWTESVIVRLEDTKNGRSPDAGASLGIKDATFRGDVRAVDGRTGDNIKAALLQVWFAQTDDRKTVLTKAYAHGHAVGHIDDADVEAEDMVVTNAATSKRATDRMFEPDQVVATGNETTGDPVVFNYTRDPKKPVKCTGAKIVASAMDRAAIIYGNSTREADITQTTTANDKPAKNTIVGQEIRLRQGADSSLAAFVVGKGHIVFMTDKDLEGRQLPSPRDINISWTRSMDYYASKENREKDDNAIFTGDVKLTTDTDYMECQKMTVLFEKPPATVGKPAVATATTAPSKTAHRLTIDMEDFSARKMAKITADDKVLLKTSHEEDDQLVQRTQVRSDQMIYDVAKKTVDMHGRGTMVHEDYRKPAPAANAAAGEGSMGFGLSKMDPPAQTVFKWNKDMQWLQESRTVTMLGDVRMEHRSGKDIVNVEDKFKADLKKGQTTSLYCQSMLARFAEPEPKKRPAPVDAGAGKPVQATAVSSTGPATTGPAAKKAVIDLAGPSMGPMEEFTAVTDVNITEGPMNILGQRVLYDRAKGLMEIRGYLKDQQPAKASLHFEDASDPLAKPKHWENAIIKCILKDGRITKVETADGSSGGGIK